MNFIHKYFLVVLLAITKMGIAQTFITKVSAKSIGKNDVVEVQYIAENLELSDFVLPKFPGWQIQSGPNFSSNRVQAGSQVKQQIVYSFLLQPARTGKLSVPSATIVIDQHNSRQSNTVSVDVKNVDHLAGGNQQRIIGSQPGSLFDEPAENAEDDYTKDQVLRNGESPVNKIKNNLLIRLEISKPSCYVGEPVVATYKLCTRLRSQSRVVKQPEFNGCTVLEMTGEQSVPRREMINGKMYNVYVIRKVQLTPLQEGDLSLPQAQVANNVTFYKAEGLNYRDLFYNRPSNSVIEQEVTVSSPKNVLHIKSLPLPQPGGFDGAIGKFTISASMGNDAIVANNNSRFIVVVEGPGNLQPAKAPPIKWPAGIEAFDPIEEEETDKGTSPATIRKTFIYPFIVSKKGEYTIPSLPFSYFNSGTGKYETLITAARSFKVKAARKQIFRVTNFANDFQTRLYILLAAGLVAVLAGLYWYNKKGSIKKPAAPLQPEPAQEKKAVPDVVDLSVYIHNVRELNPVEDGSFYKRLHKCVQEYLMCRFQLKENEVATFLEKQGTELDSMFIQLQSLLQDCSLGMYTPVFDAEAAMQHRLKAIELLCKLEKG